MIKSILFFMVITSFSFGAIPPKPEGWDDWTFDQKRSWRGENLDPRIPYGILVDKLRVKEIIEKQNFVKVAKTLSYTNDPKTISTDTLPARYLMKANNGCKRGAIVKDGMILGISKHNFKFKPVPATTEELQRYATSWLKSPYCPIYKDKERTYRERQYCLVKPMILFEEFLENLTIDVELFCFYGKVKMVKIAYYRDRFRVFFYDLDWNLIRTNTNGEKQARPVWLDSLIAFTEQLVENIDHVRVDYFVCNSQDLYFGEFTFTSGVRVVPEKVQKEMGGYWLYPEEGVVGDKFGLIEVVTNEKVDVL